jgi:hypothetical protein
MDSISLDDVNKKQITIQGTNNRYQIKKLVEKREKKKRVGVSFPPEFLAHKKQRELLKRLFSEEEESKIVGFMKRELERKIASYKQQDKEKEKDMDFLSNIDLEKVKCLLDMSDMKCFYCSCEVLILYEMARENKQWTLDRIDNDQGHTQDNVVISCLECNLQRRRTQQEKFLFTKQLKIVKRE